MANLDDLYREIILDHYRSPRNRGEIKEPSARVEGFNPLCGDEVVIYLSVEDGVITDVKLSGHGCSISQASSSMMTTAIKGKTLAEAHKVIDRFKEMMTLKEASLEDVEESPEADLRSLGELAALAGVVKFPVRIKCATLSWNTLSQALDEVESAS